MATANGGVKLEDDVNIKSELDNAAPTGFADDDEYEDTGELTMPRGEQEIWLARVPKWMWTALSTANETDDPIQVGRIDFFPPDMSLPPSERSQRGKFTFSSNWPKATGIPKEYDVALTKDALPNTHIFSEKDLPGYKPHSYNRNMNNRGTDFNAGQANQDGKPGFRIQKRQRYRKAIPKHTALHRTLKKEVNCTPVENQEYRDYMEIRKKEGEKSEITLENGGDYLPTNAEMNFGTLIVSLKRIELVAITNMRTERHHEA